MMKFIILLFIYQSITSTGGTKVFYPIDDTTLDSISPCTSYSTKASIDVGGVQLPFHSESWYPLYVLMKYNISLPDVTSAILNCNHRSDTLYTWTSAYPDNGNRIYLWNSTTTNWTGSTAYFGSTGSCSPATDKSVNQGNALTDSNGNYQLDITSLVQYTNTQGILTSILLEPVGPSTYQFNSFASIENSDNSTWCKITVTF